MAVLWRRKSDSVLKLANEAAFRSNLRMALSGLPGYSTDCILAGVCKDGEKKEGRERKIANNMTVRMMYQMSFINIDS